MYVFLVLYRCCIECANDIFAVGTDDCEKCPHDLQVIQRRELFPDVYAKRELFGLKCFCSNKKRGCEWKGEYSRFREHYSVCAYADVNCVYSNHGCDAVVPRSELAHHIEKDWPFRLVDCEHCESKYHAKDSSDHLKECPKVLVECPHGCNRDKFFRELLPEHGKSCSKMPTTCVFNDVGCNFRGPRESLDGHLDSNAAEHLILAGNFIRVVLARLELTQKIVDSCVEANKEHEEQLSAQQKTITLNKTTLFAHQKKISNKESSLEHLKTFRVDDGRTRKQLELLDERLSVVGTEIEAIRGSRDPPQFSSSGSRGMERLDHHLKLHEIQIQDQAQAISRL